MEEKKIYFPGLNGIRAIAAVIVMVFHTDQWCGYFGLKPYGFWNTRMQTYAVVLFFVLSGFLITYLLLKEKEKFKQIDYRKFYTRRILRIWPVYYTVLLTGTILLLLFPLLINQGPNQNLTITVLLYSILLPNIGFFLGYCPDIIGILWSVGAEEQFYVFWPLFINKAKNIFRSLIIFLISFLLVKAAAGIGLFNFLPFNLSNLLFFLPFDCMAIGAIAANLYYTKNKLLLLIYHPAIQVLAWAFLIVSIFWEPIQIPFLKGLNRDCHAVVYAVIILNVSTNAKTLLTLENKTFQFIGKISYGIYAFHFIILFLLSLLFKNILADLPSMLGHLILFFCEISATFFVAFVSHKHLESWFLQRKKKYMLIRSENTRVAEIIPSPEKKVKETV